MQEHMKSSIRGSRLLVAAFLILLLNTSYIAAYADPTLFYFANVALHIVLGFVLSILFIVYVLRRFRTFSWPMRLASIVLLIGAGFGWYITKVGTTRPHYWALQWHVALSVLGSIPLLVIIFRAASGRLKSPKKALAYVVIACF